MIAFLRGKVQEKRSQGIILDVNGVGYDLWLSSKSLSEVPSINEEASFYTYLYVREDTLQLFGFTSCAEKDLFEQLISVSGIGPKVAISILSAFTVPALKKAIIMEDVDLVTSIPGIGKKTAQRLILELKEKLALPDLKVASGSATGSVFSEARNALVSLGCTLSEANKALENFLPSDDEVTVEKLVRHALKNLS